MASPTQRREFGVRHGRTKGLGDEEGNRAGGTSEWGREAAGCLESQGKNRLQRAGSSAKMNTEH